MTPLAPTMGFKWLKYMAVFICVSLVTSSVATEDSTLHQKGKDYNGKNEDDFREKTTQGEAEHSQENTLDPKRQQSVTRAKEQQKFNEQRYEKRMGMKLAEEARAREGRRRRILEKEKNAHGNGHLDPHSSQHGSDAKRRHMYKSGAQQERAKNSGKEWTKFLKPEDWDSELFKGDPLIDGSEDCGFLMTKIHLHCNDRFNKVPLESKPTLSCPRTQMMHETKLDCLRDWVSLLGQGCREKIKQEYSKVKELLKEHRRKCSGDL